jgi:hypothetical protein
MLPANAVVVPVVDYGPDPADSWVRALTRDIMTRLQGRAGQPIYAGADGDPESSLGGYALSPQSFLGAASRATTNVTGRDGAYPDIASGIVEGPMGDPARRIFAARLARGGH